MYAPPVAADAVEAVGPGDRHHRDPVANVHQQERVRRREVWQLTTPVTS